MGYADSESFSHKDEMGGGKSSDVVGVLHKILRPFRCGLVFIWCYVFGGQWLRIRVCWFAEKYINICAGLTEMQRKWYLSVLEKNIDAVNGLTSKECNASVNMLM